MKKSVVSEIVSQKSVVSKNCTILIRQNVMCTVYFFTTSTVCITVWMQKKGAVMRKSASGLSVQQRLRSICTITRSDQQGYTGLDSTPSIVSIDPIFQVVHARVQSRMV